MHVPVWDSPRKGFSPNEALLKADRELFGQYDFAQFYSTQGHRSDDKARYEDS